MVVVVGGGIVVALFCFIIFFWEGGESVGRFSGMGRGKRINWGLVVNMTL